MNREIKFRCWDVENNRMWWNVQNAYDMLYSHDKPTIDEDNQGDAFFPESFGEVLRKPESYVVMQFTGLKDKNDKEIYEGDILKITEENETDHGFYFKIGENLVVCWDEFYCGFGLRVIGNYVSDLKMKPGCLDRNWDSLVSENGEIPIGGYAEICGNIFENPSLLEPK